MVKGLQALYKSATMKTTLTMRAASVYVKFEISAARKICRFKSHFALLGCHKWFKNISTTGFGAKRDYYRHNWKCDPMLYIINMPDEWKM